TEAINSILLNKWVLYAVVVLVSWLMVSNLRIMALKFPDFTIKNNWPKIVLLLISLVAILLLKWLAVPLIFIVYILLSLFFKSRV
ncbi:MAG: CDP-alcohol phosphatidyltransferase, partial [Ferruginibacter sp.]